MMVAERKVAEEEEEYNHRLVVRIINSIKPEVLLEQKWMSNS